MQLLRQLPHQCQMLFTLTNCLVFLSCWGGGGGLQAKVDVHLASVDDGATALFFASMSGHTDVVHALLAAGSDITVVMGESENDPALSGSTCLVVGASFGHVGVVEALLDAGADAAATSATGLTARDAASSKEHDAVVALLDRHAV